MRASARRSTANQAALIAVWDMDNVFPALDNSVVAMNRVQREFGFELAELSVPLGVWDLESEKGTAYFWAEHLVKRLQRMPMELGVQVLACVTRHWMRDNETLNLYCWWGSDIPIVIFSVAGFEELAPEGPETDRVIPNALVSILAVYFGDFGTHEEPPRNCPMWYNENRDFKALLSQQKFDAKCHKELRRKLGAKLGALEALLKPFP